MTTPAKRPRRGPSILQLLLAFGFGGILGWILVERGYTAWGAIWRSQLLYWVGLLVVVVAYQGGTAGSGDGSVGLLVLLPVVVVWLGLARWMVVEAPAAVARRAEVSRSQETTALPTNEPTHWRCPGCNRWVLTSLQVCPNCQYAVAPQQWRRMMGGG